MNFFKKAIKEVEEYDKAIEACKEMSCHTPKPEEGWVWVEGYKATDANMQCRGYQYELGVQYDMPEDKPIQVCESGFHLCLQLHDVFYYYSVGNGVRFFKVKALVRKADKDNYRGAFRCGDTWYNTNTSNNKLAAKSIIFTSELTYDEILKNTDAQNLPEEYKKIAIESSIQNAINQYEINILVEDGYSIPFATYIIKSSKFDIAHAFGSQKDLSMDMKVLGILYNTQGV